MKKIRLVSKLTDPMDFSCLDVCECWLGADAHWDAVEVDGTVYTVPVSHMNIKSSEFPEKP